MNTEEVEADLSARIMQSRVWLESNPAPIMGFKFRNHLWHATPVAFLDDVKRIERHGVAFAFSLDDAAKSLKVILNVRIKPEATIGEKDDSPPYIVIYVANQSLGAEDAITWQKITVPNSYKDLLGLPLEDWYRKWINYALVSKGAKKIFDPAMKLSD